MITDIDEAEVLVVKLERIGAACLITLTALCHGIAARGRDLPVGRPLVFPDRATFTIAGEYGFEIGFHAGAQSDRREALGPCRTARRRDASSLRRAGSSRNPHRARPPRRPLPSPPPSRRARPPPATPTPAAPMRDADRVDNVRVRPRTESGR